MTKSDALTWIARRRERLDEELGDYKFAPASNVALGASRAYTAELLEKILVELCEG
jgi:hypothetical protein